MRCCFVPARPSRLYAAALGGDRGPRSVPDTFKFFQVMGVPLRTLYGQTELLGAYTLHRFGKVDPDTTGVAMADNIEIRIDNPDIHGVGEIVVRHPTCSWATTRALKLRRRYERRLDAVGRCRLFQRRQGSSW